MQKILFKSTKKSSTFPNFSQLLLKTSTKLLCWLLFIQFSSVAQSCPTLCDTMNRSTPGLPVHHQLPESNETHVGQVGDAI